MARGGEYPREPAMVVAAGMTSGMAGGRMNEPRIVEWTRTGQTVPTVDKSKYRRETQRAGPTETWRCRRPTE